MASVVVRDGPGVKVEIRSSGTSVTLGTGVASSTRDALLSAGGGGAMVESIIRRGIVVQNTVPGSSVVGLDLVFGEDAAADAAADAAVAPTPVAFGAPRGSGSGRGGAEGAVAAPVLSEAGTYEQFVGLAQEWFQKDFRTVRRPRVTVTAGRGGAALVWSMPACSLALACFRAPFALCEAEKPPYEMTVTVDGAPRDVFKDERVVHAWSTRLQ